MTEVFQSTPDLDLSSCDKELIRIPGSVQPHGFLLALSRQLTILQASENLLGLVGIPVSQALGQTLFALFGQTSATLVADALEHAEIGQRPKFLCAVNLCGKRFEVVAHHYDSLLMLEFEQAVEGQPADLRNLYRQVGDSLLKLNKAPTVEEMALMVAQDMQSVTGFGRVMVYRFDDDGHGHVLAEAREDGYPSYLGQRFPASDIPRQARELYVSNRVRLIQDANYNPARLVPEVNPITGAATDLSFAALRSVSPIHLQYMRNMHTLASMSVSLVIKGKLWGLVSCHHETPCPVPFDRRTVCEQLGQILAMCIDARENDDDLKFRLEVRRIMVSMLSGLTQGADFINNMASVFPSLLQFARAGGAAILYDDRLLSYGDSPSEEQIRDLVAWLDLNPYEEVFHTDQLSVLYPPAAAFTHNASGLLAMPISRIHKHYLLWFRPEIVHAIDWAGKPQDKNPNGGAISQLSPRTSFETWRETIHGTSAPWHSGEIELATEFRFALLGLVLERAEQMAELAEDLGRANKELEAFSYSVSHDLRAPLRHIVGYSDLLLEPAGSDNPEQRQRFLKNIKDSARLAGKLVDDLLSFSQMGRAALRLTSIAMGDLVRACLDKLSLDTKGRNIEWDIGPLPTLTADPNFLQLALYNLMSNAVKFTGQKELAVIRISASENEHEWIISVADNGAGFNMDYVHKLFGVFQRLHRMEDFQGTGIGLANVRRIVERHGGRVWAESQQDLGATFNFSIPKVLGN